MKVTSITCYALALLSCLVQGKRTLIEDYSGPQFFSKMDFFSDPDPTHGHVRYADMATANSSGLAGLFKTMHSDQAVFLGTDHKNPAPNGRPSVRVGSQHTYNSGLFIADISHMPGGVCGAWPAFWLFGTSDPWPQAGEIDIIEGINLNIDNTMALHVGGDFTINGDVNAMSAHLESFNADINAAKQPHNKGAVAIAPNNSKTYGAEFNANMGGVYATEVNPSAKRISIWFFPRDAIPADVTSDDPQPSTWGKPLADFSGNDLDFAGKFKKLQIIINLTFCGEWAGKPSLWGASECSKLADTCEAYVSDDPKAFEDMYWAINSLQPFDINDGSAPPTWTVGPPLLASSTAVASIQTSPPTPTNSSNADPGAVPTAAPAGESIPRIPYPNNSAASPPHHHSRNCTSHPGDHPHGTLPTTYAPPRERRREGQTYAFPPFSTNTPSSLSAAPSFPKPNGARPYGTAHPSGAAHPSNGIVFPTNFVYNPTLRPSGAARPSRAARPSGFARPSNTVRLRPSNGNTSGVSLPTNFFYDPKPTGFRTSTLTAARNGGLRRSEGWSVT